MSQTSIGNLLGTCPGPVGDGELQRVLPPALGLGKVKED